jgi:hypothetical protein
MIGVLPRNLEPVTDFPVNDFQGEAFAATGLTNGLLQYGQVLPGLSFR